jgi:hypothetical protein
MVEAVGWIRLRNILFRKCGDWCWLLLLISFMGSIDLSLQSLDRVSVLDYKLENDLAAIRLVQCEGRVEWALVGVETISHIVFDLPFPPHLGPCSGHRNLPPSRF